MAAAAAAELRCTVVSSFTFVQSGQLSIANVVFQSLIHELPAQHSQMHTLVASADWRGDSGCSRLAKQSSSSSPLIALCREGSEELWAALKVARCAMTVPSGEESVSELGEGGCG